MTERVTISGDEIAELVRNAVRAEFHAVGLRADEPEHIDEAREDFRFIRRMRKSVEGAANRVGMAILLAIVGGLISAVTFGVKAMLAR